MHQPQTCYLHHFAPVAIHHNFLFTSLDRENLWTPDSWILLLLFFQLTQNRRQFPAATWIDVRVWTMGRSHMTWQTQGELYKSPLKPILVTLSIKTQIASSQSDSKFATHIKTLQVIKWWLRWIFEDSVYFTFWLEPTCFLTLWQCSQIQMLYSSTVKFYYCAKCRPIQQGHDTPPAEQQVVVWGFWDQ